MLRTLSIILAAILLFSALPLTAVAADTDDVQTSETNKAQDVMQDNGITFEPAGTASDGLTVTSKSNFFGTKTIPYGDTPPSQVVLEYYCDTDKYMFLSGDYGVNYDPEVLQLNEESNKVGGRLNVFPITNGGGVFNFNKAIGNFLSLGYDLVDENGKPIPVVRLVFDVVGSGSTEVELCVKAQSCASVDNPEDYTGYVDKSYFPDYNGNNVISEMNSFLTNNGAKIYTTFIPDDFTPIVINDLKVSLTEPEPGKAPDFSPVVPADSGYAVDSEDGVGWFDVTNNGIYIFPDSGYVFEPYHEYRVMITLVTVKDKDAFASSNRRATLNDMKVGFSDYGENRDHKVYIESRFICAPEGGAAIREVEVETDEPSPGGSPYYNALVDSDRYSISNANDSDEEYISGGIGWYNVTDKCQMRYTDRFRSGKTYRWSILLQSGEFPFAPADEISATFKGNKASVERISDRLIRLWYDFTISTFTGEPTVIDSVAITIPEPAAGEKPSFTATVPDGAGYCLESRSDNIYHDGIAWVRCSDWHYLEPGVDTFEEGEEYSCNMRLTTVSDKYVFADSSNSIGVTINDAEALCFSRYSDDLIAISSSRRFTVPYSEQIVIDTIDLTVDEPVAGEKPSYTATVPAGANYDVKSITVGYIKNGIEWSRVSDDYTLQPDVDTFEAGEEYLCRVEVKTVSDKYVFADSDGDLNITINGHKAITYYRYSDYRIDVINDIDQPFTVSEAGSTVSGTATSYLSDTDTVTIQLLQSDSVKYSTTVTGKTASYSIPNVANGEYTLRVSKKNHVTRDYEITVSGNTIQDVKICPIGDADNNGRVNAADAKAAFQHGNEQKLITDDYKFKCADVASPKGRVNSADAKAIFQHANEQKSLWTE